MGSNRYGEKIKKYSHFVPYKSCCTVFSKTCGIHKHKSSHPSLSRPVSLSLLSPLQRCSPLTTCPLRSHTDTHMHKHTHTCCQVCGRDASNVQHLFYHQISA
uniref:Uncharacterized protein n=1 Tax=Acanthochromis polyacanthus TaxID=80966 RepID=A0A3Q1G213_9TELE